MAAVSASDRLRIGTFFRFFGANDDVVAGSD